MRDKFNILKINPPITVSAFFYPSFISLIMAGAYLREAQVNENHPRIHP